MTWQGLINSSQGHSRTKHAVWTSSIKYIHSKYFSIIKKAKNWYTKTKGTTDQELNCSSRSSAFFFNSSSIETLQRLLVFYFNIVNIILLCSAGRSIESSGKTQDVFRYLVVIKWEMRIFYTDLYWFTIPNSQLYYLSNQAIITCSPVVKWMLLLEEDWGSAVSCEVVVESKVEERKPVTRFVGHTLSILSHLIT